MIPEISALVLLCVYGVGFVTGAALCGTPKHREKARVYETSDEDPR